MNRKKILLKLSGTIFQEKRTRDSSSFLVHHIADQIKQLKNKYQFGIVIGGGNFFRGSQHGKKLGTRPMVNHYAGMVATIINGLLLQDLLSQDNVNADLLSAFNCPEFAKPISPQNINRAFDKNDCVIFSGGTGNPYFTTDTNAVIRALEIDTKTVWKATDVDGVYDSDPNKNKNAKLIQNVSYEEAKTMNLKIMDQTAFTLASEHDISVQVFNIFEKNALMSVAQDKNFGSTIC